MNIKNLVRIIPLLISSLGVLAAQEVTDDKPLLTIFPHPEGRFWISGQANFILQRHGGFPALYSGPNSLKDTSEHAFSRVFTLYTGVEVKQGTELLFDVESTGGRGISDALGLAGFTNVDVVRNPDLGPKPYIARIMIHQTIAVSGRQSEQERNPFSISKTVPEKRLEIRLGKFSVADFFDTNSVGSDSHLQFTNWTVVNSGAYDYAADTRGYTYGLTLEYQQPRFGVRFGEMLMPKVANGIDLDWDLRRAHSENLEFEIRPSILASQKTTIRALSYFNTANMGDYREAVAAFLHGIDAKPDITAHRHQGSLKYGLGLNIEQTLPDHFRAFARAGWNEGRHESFAYTEANNTGLVGIDLAGEQWHRKLDKIGSAFVSNGLSNDHAEYLRLGGQGFLLGDGTLRYRREDIWESYYTAHIWRGIFASAQAQFISNPGYNQDRGPVWVPGARMHIDF
jgi:high affinity Mn2+ porin